MGLLGVDLNKDPGTGNLNLRACFAAIVGPSRVAHGRRSVVRVQAGRPVLILGNKTQEETMYFEVWLPQSSILALPGGGAFLGLMSGETGGQTAVQTLFNATQRYSGVLLPSEQVFAEAVTDALGGALAAQVPVVVSSVVF
ncbi:MAG: hypothetical protein ACE5F6_00310 [Anaerolineae bacterium]